jgi:aryl-alcohol dehydrogenase-like predicted oxidoreductase
MRQEDLDFVQFSYNIIHRHAEKEIFPIAADKGIATLINMPFQRGELFKRTANQPLPGWASEIDCSSWAQIFLKYSVSHPAATCVIPATSSIKHMQDNMQAGYGRLPDAALRKRMAKDFESLV